MAGTDDAPDAPTVPVGRTITYQPALDGVRALAVAAVLLFHAEVAGFGGGYLGVSVFFTLSGFLITSLLAVEHDRHGSVAFGAFYARRARRLLPASVLLVLLVVIAAAVTDWFDGVADLRSHVVGSLLQVANWVFLANDGSYQELLQQAAGAASPLEHYWSLAIEEQFYWLWPVAFVGIWRLGRTHRGRLLVLGAITVAFVVAAPLIASGWGGDAAYWASPARAAEILAGAFLALAIMGRRLDPRLWLLAPAMLIVLAVCVVTFPASGGPAYAGWLPAIGVASALLLLGLQVDSPVRRACSIAPLVWLGRISYGVYLFHWPIFVVLNEDRVGFGGPALVALRLALTLVVAQISFTLYEQPIRGASRLTIRPTMGLAALATAGAVVAAFVVVPGPSSDYWSTDSDTVAAAALTADDAPLVPATNSTTVTTVTTVTVATTAPAAPSTDAAVPSTDPVATGSTDPPATPVPTQSTLPPIPELGRPVRVVIAGDSTAEALGAGLVNWAAFAPEAAQAEVNVQRGCGFVRGGEYLVGDEWFEVRDECDRWLTTDLPERVAEVSPDVVVLMTTSFDVLDHRFDGGPAIDTEGLRDTIRADFAAITDALLASGAGSVVWIKAPLPNPLWFSLGTDQEQPERHAVLHDVMDQLAAERPGDVYTVDLLGYFDDAGIATTVEIRPDGVHFTPDAATDIVVDFLAEQITRSALDLFGDR